MEATASSLSSPPKGDLPIDAIPDNQLNQSQKRTEPPASPNARQDSPKKARQENIPEQEEHAFSELNEHGQENNWTGLQKPLQKPQDIAIDSPNDDSEDLNDQFEDTADKSGHTSDSHAQVAQQEPNQSVPDLWEIMHQEKQMAAAGKDSKAAETKATTMGENEFDHAADVIQLDRQSMQDSDSSSERMNGKPTDGDDGDEEDETESSINSDVHEHEDALFSRTGITEADREPVDTSVKPMVQSPPFDRHPHNDVDVETWSGPGNGGILPGRWSDFFGSSKEGQDSDELAPRPEIEYSPLPEGDHRPEAVSNVEGHDGSDMDMAPRYDTADQMTPQSLSIRGSEGDAGELTAEVPKDANEEIVISTSPPRPRQANISEDLKRHEPFNGVVLEEQGPDLAGHSASVSDEVTDVADSVNGEDAGDAPIVHQIGAITAMPVQTTENDTSENVTLTYPPEGQAGQDTNALEDEGQMEEDDSWPPGLPVIQSKYIRKVMRLDEEDDGPVRNSGGVAAAERFEFVGDMLIHGLIGMIIYEMFPDWNKEQMLRLRQDVMSPYALSEYRAAYEFEDRSAEKKDASKADLESGQIDYVDELKMYIGGLIFDSERGTTYARHWLRELVAPMIQKFRPRAEACIYEDFGPIDMRAKYKLSVLVAKSFPRSLRDVTYHEVHSRPEAFPHKTASCRVAGRDYGIGRDVNMKFAEIRAAMKALEVVIPECKELGVDVDKRGNLVVKPKQQPAQQPPSTA